MDREDLILSYHRMSTVLAVIGLLTWIFVIAAIWFAVVWVTS